MVDDVTTALVHDVRLAFLGDHQNPLLHKLSISNTIALSSAQQFLLFHNNFFTWGSKSLVYRLQPISGIGWKFELLIFFLRSLEIRFWAHYTPGFAQQVEFS
jgi:hypothetical protein